MTLAVGLTLTQTQTQQKFSKKLILKKISKRQKAWTIFPGGKELSQTLDSEHLEYILASTQDFGTNCTCAKPPLIFCMLGNCSCFCCRLLTFFKMNFFKKFFQEHYQSVKQFGSRSGPMFCLSRSGSKLLAKVMTRRQKSALARK